VNGRLCVTENLVEFALERHNARVIGAKHAILLELQGL
jgi:hypothetical protein